MYMKEFIKKLIRENIGTKIMYHGTALPINNFNFEKFLKVKGYSSSTFLGVTEEERFFGFITPNKEMAIEYANHTIESKPKNYKKALIVVYVDFSKLNIIDLSNEETFEDNLNKIGFKLWDSGYGYGVNDMWKLLDEPEIVKLIKNAGFNSVKLIEDSVGIIGISYGILLDEINECVKIKEVVQIDKINENILKSKTKKGNRFLEMLRTKKFRHYDGNVLVDFTGGEGKRKELVSKLSKEDKKTYKKWLETDDGKHSLSTWAGDAINENINIGHLGLIQTSDYIILMNQENIIAVATYEKIDEGLYHLPAMASEKGYGFLLFNIILSLINPNYLIADRDSSTSQMAIKMLNRAYTDKNIEHFTLSPDDKNYFKFDREDEIYNTLVNTKFKIKTPINLTELRKNGLALSKKLDMDEMNEKAFQFFSSKLS